MYKAIIDLFWVYMYAEYKTDLREQDDKHRKQMESRKNNKISEINDSLFHSSFKLEKKRKRVCFYDI